MARLELERLSRRYGDFHAVRDLTLDIADGELVVFLGPSGCGKTTTLRMIAGFVEPSMGTVILGGRNITQLPPWKRNTGLVFQNYALFPHLTVAQNVAFGLETRGMSAAEIAPRVEEALRRVRMGHLAARLPRQLSGGQQQRVALARALVFKPDVLLLDEPLSNLDAKLRQEVRIEIRELQRALGMTTVMVTHDQDEALTMADRLVVMNEGRVHQVGTQRDLYERPADPFVAGFVGQSSFLEGTMEGPGYFRTGGGLRIRCPDRASRLGEAALLTLRPERVNVSASPMATADNSFPGEVEFVRYLGSLIDIHVRLSKTERVIAQVPNRDGDFEPRIGEKVHVHWAAADATVFVAAAPIPRTTKELLDERV